MKKRVVLTRDPLIEAVEREFVSAADHGAVVLFSGVVRNIHEGRETAWIHYTAYETLALHELNAVVDEVSAGHSVGAVSLVHRLGRLPVGTASLLVAVGARHRRPAFECALAIVDLLKKRVPIWKQEEGPDGLRWADGEQPPAPR